MDEIDRRYALVLLYFQLPFDTEYSTNSIAAIAPFTGLRRFPQGRGFKQWTGNDSKALMKVRPPHSCIFFVCHN